MKGAFQLGQDKTLNNPATSLLHRELTLHILPGTGWSAWPTAIAGVG